MGLRYGRGGKEDEGGGRKTDECEEDERGRGGSLGVHVSSFGPAEPTARGKESAEHVLNWPRRVYQGAE